MAGATRKRIGNKQKRRRNICRILTIVSAGFFCFSATSVYAAQEETGKLAEIGSAGEERPESGTLSGNIPQALNARELPSDAGALSDVADECARLNLEVEIRGEKVVITGKKASLPADIEIPEGVTDIEGGFASDKTIKNLVIPSTVRNIADRAFENSKLETVVFREGIEEIGEGIFFNCSMLKSVEFPDSLVSLGDAAFAQSGIEALDLSGCRLETTGKDTFRQCNNLKSIKLNEGLKTIGESAFAQCTAVEELKLPDSVETIGADAFNSCQLKNTIDLSNTSLKNIDTHAFAFNEKVEEIILPDSVSKVGIAAFSRCLNVKRINMPKGLVSIGINAFALHSNVLENTELILPEGVTDIGTSAFAGWNNLKTVDFSKARNLHTVGSILFSSGNADPEVIVSNMETLIVPISFWDGSCSVDRQAFLKASCKTVIAGIEQEAPDGAAMKNYRNIVLRNGGGADRLKAFGLDTSKVTSFGGSLNGVGFDLVALDFQHKIASEYYDSYAGLSGEALWEISCLAGEGKEYEYANSMGKLGEYGCDNFYDLCLDLVQSGNIALLDSEVKPKVDELCGRLYDSAADLSSELPKGISDINITDTRGEKKGGE